MFRSSKTYLLFPDLSQINSDNEKVNDLAIEQRKILDKSMLLDTKFFPVQSPRHIIVENKEGKEKEPSPVSLDRKWFLLFSKLKRGQSTFSTFIIDIQGMLGSFNEIMISMFN
ncbi:hypothetical protein F8M41_022885 [Gigaspora margarita]|uniref:Uncharacterized protein n=1 Tax=Gigaspora margarita TaxID=4874 RepID=A0A8H4AED0_GIGMA|nr:hypothetical protein F8M41_022885 [Gigaspora margarita]